MAIRMTISHVRLLGLLSLAAPICGASFVSMSAGAASAFAQEAPARPGIDAPELAALGPHGAGVTTLQLVQPGQLDPLQGVDASARADRRLAVRIWYPARRGGTPIVYHSALPGPDARPVDFTIPGIAVTDAPAEAGRFPLVILAHGYSNTPEVLAWLGENLATKGYVVVAPAFRDPPITDRERSIGPLARRPLDIAFVAAEAQRRARAGEVPFAHTDPERTALIGYSMGSYGALTAAGAPLDPRLAAATRGVLAPYVAGGAKSGELKVAALKAVVAISSPMSFGSVPLWAPDGLAAIRVPTFFIVGSQDHLVGYDPGVRTLFAGETNAPRYLLTFREAGHNIGMSGAPTQMQARLWDKDWFEDPVWRKARLMAIEAHFITAFLDRYVQGDAGKSAYIDGLVSNSDDGVWPNAPAVYGAFSPGAPAATLWKGFQPAHATGMTLEFRPAGDGPAGDHAGATNAADAPEALRPPAQERLLLSAHASGAQIYRCAPGADGKFGWTLKGPDAQLRDEHGTLIGQHSPGPSWKHNDGSEVTGKAMAHVDSPDPASVPWLLLSAVGHAGHGVLEHVTSIQRLHTVGGAAPPVSQCDASKRDTEVRSPYSADYYFYGAASGD
jgi:predicted dienelactone hydrolase